MSSIMLAFLSRYLFVRMSLATSGISWWLSLSLGPHIVWLGFYIVVFDTSCVMFHHVASHVLVGGGFSGCGVGLRSREGGGRDDRHAVSARIWSALCNFAWFCLCGCWGWFGGLFISGVVCWHHAWRGVSASRGS